MFLFIIIFIFADNNVFLAAVQEVPADFSMKTFISELLETNGFNTKRARTMDIDDFLS